MNEAIRSDATMLLPASAVFVAIAWFATDLDLLSRVVTMVISWTAFMLVGVLGSIAIRRVRSRTESV